MIFPSDYVPCESTINLFKKWAVHTNDEPLIELIDKNERSSNVIQELIVSRIKDAFNKALQAFTYKCILMVWVPTPSVCLHPNYHRVFRRYENRKDVKYVDIGCCMGTDLRYVCCNEYDSVKIENAMGIDIQEEFFMLDVIHFSMTLLQFEEDSSDVILWKTNLYKKAQIHCCYHHF